MKSLKTALFAAAAMASSAFAGSAAPSGKGVVVPAPAPACPTAPSYNNAIVSWQHGWVDGLDNTNGVGFDLSGQVFSNVYLRGTAGWNDTFDWGFTAGAGYFIPLQENLHFVVEAGGLFDDDDQGFYVHPHLRAKLGCLEVWAGGKFLKYSDFDGFWEGHLDLFYQVAQNLDLAVGGIIGEDAQTLSVGIRYRY
jgi:hypothetical protein